VHKSKCMSEKNINAILDRINAEHAARPVARPSATECTGCGVIFSKDDIDDEKEDDMTYPDEVCDDCGVFYCYLITIDLVDNGLLELEGYMACESCACSHSRGS
jgi:hypothetical protein